MQRQLREHELVETDTFLLCLTDQGGAERFGDADVELAAEFLALRTDRWIGQAVDQFVYLLPVFRSGKSGAIRLGWKQPRERTDWTVDGVVGCCPKLESRL